MCVFSQDLHTGDHLFLLPLLPPTRFPRLLYQQQFWSEVMTVSPGTLRCSCTWQSKPGTWPKRPSIHSLFSRQHEASMGTKTLQLEHSTLGRSLWAVSATFVDLLPCQLSCSLLETPNDFLTVDRAPLLGGRGGKPLSGYQCLIIGNRQRQELVRLLRTEISRHPDLAVTSHLSSSLTPSGPEHPRY
jgi:hypothetical protein